MEDLENVEAEIISRDGSIQDGHIILAERPQGERVKAAFKNFALFFSATIFAVFIPVLHFVLVPLLFIATVFMTANAYLNSHDIESGELVCAKCKTVQLVEPRAEVYPLIYECEKCGSRLTGYRRSANLDD